MLSACSSQTDATEQEAEEYLNTEVTDWAIDRHGPDLYARTNCFDVGGGEFDCNFEVTQDKDPWLRLEEGEVSVLWDGSSFSGSPGDAPLNPRIAESETLFADRVAATLPENPGWNVKMADDPDPDCTADRDDLGISCDVSVVQSGNYGRAWGTVDWSTGSPEVMLNYFSFPASVDFSVNKDIT